MAELIPGHSAVSDRFAPAAQVPAAWMQRIERMLERVLDESSRSGSSDRESPFLSTRSATDGSVESDARQDGVGDGGEIEPEVWELLLGSIGTSLLVATGLNIHDRTAFRDPLKEGVVTVEAWQAVYAL